MRSRSVKKRQYGIYALLLVLTAVTASAAYQLLHHDKVLFRRAETRFAKGDYPAAKELYEEAYSRGPQPAAGAVNLLSVYRALGLREVDPKIMRMLHKQLETPEALSSVADWYAALGKWREAADLLMGRQSVWAGEPGIMLRLADMYRSLGNKQEAEHYYRRALSLNPRSFYGRFRLAQSLAWSKRYDEAESLFRSILLDHPEQRLTLISLARILSWQERFKEAIEIYTQVLKEST